MQEMIPAWDNLPALSWKEKIAYLGWEFKKLKQTECPVAHLFEGSLYIREMYIPAGTMFLGREHKIGHECQLIKGSVVIVAPEGRWRVDAPFAITTTPGYHMVLYALTDVVGRTVHPMTGQRNIDALEDEIFGSTDDLDLLGQELHKRMLTT